jgi:HK97 family phage prohead protease
MPYYISKKAKDCSGWGVIDAQGDVLGCHKTKKSAIAQAVAVSIETEEPFEGERAAIGELNIGDFVSWDVNDPEILGEIDLVAGAFAVVRIYELEHTIYKPTDTLVIMNVLKLARVPRPELTAERFDNSPEPEVVDDPIDSLDIEDRAVDLTAPAFMRAAARRGLKLYEEGHGGDGLVDATIREARAMATGNVTADKWTRISAWIARHMPDLDAPQNSDRTDPEYPGPGLVAHLLWGSSGTKRGASRTKAYADNIVARLEAESKRGNNMAKRELRTNIADFEIRESGNGMTFVGYAAVFDSPSEPLPFIERIARGAFQRSLKSRNEVKLLWNHDMGSVLGSLRAGTLRLVEDVRGLRVEADLPDTQLGRDTATLLRRGDITSMSFGFSVPAGGDSWNDSGTERTLRSVRLYEVSIVAMPAYQATEASVRAYDIAAQRAAVDADELADVMLKIEEGQSLTVDDVAIISNVVGSLSETTEAEATAVVTEPETPVDEPESDLELLQLKRKQLDLMLKKGI